MRRLPGEDTICHQRGSPFKEKERRRVNKYITGRKIGLLVLQRATLIGEGVVSASPGPLTPPVLRSPAGREKGVMEATSLPGRLSVTPPSRDSCPRQRPSAPFVPLRPLLVTFLPSFLPSFFPHSTCFICAFSHIRSANRWIYYLFIRPFL